MPSNRSARWLPILLQCVRVVGGGGAAREPRRFTFCIAPPPPYVIRPPPLSTSDHITNESTWERPAELGVDQQTAPPVYHNMGNVGMRMGMPGACVVDREEGRGN